MRIKQTTKEVGFRPIELTLVIETQEEYDALVEAGNSLDVFDRDGAHSFNVRDVWADILDTLAKGV